ncbi:hypothetical protein EKH77_12270 [Streptomyces luteoverticillatus]|uniref:Uncharacterized protein n=1 Tax=Streptomyces luteoverticillatus TaxID=66425 RepID=A0A3Q9FWJ5_STRLT|nr:hypothetical protein EKH77_12270 [Streptomyces luteoverticillatus]
MCCRVSGGQVRQNDTSEITSAPIRGSQAGICYWAPYSLCGTKGVRKVAKPPQGWTHPPLATKATSDPVRDRGLPASKRRTRPAVNPLHPILTTPVARPLSVHTGKQTLHSNQ